LLYSWIENERKKEKRRGVRVKCKNAMQKIYDFYISQYDSKTNSPKDNIDEKRRMEVIKSI